MNNTFEQKKEELWLPSAIPFFIFGVIYYLITPFIIMKTNLIELPTLVGIKDYINFDYFNFAYFIDVLVIFFSFLVGYKSIKLFNIKTKSSLDKASEFIMAPKILFYLFILFVIFLVFKAYFAGTVFFSGYKNYDIFVLGPFATSVFTLVWLTNYFSGRQIKIMYIILFLFVSILMLGLGSRMFFVLGAISLLLGYIIINKSFLKSSKFFILLGLIGASMILIGLWRDSSGVYTLDKFFGIFLGEPLYISVSGARYIANLGYRPFFELPFDILAGIVNFIPSVIYPEKLGLIYQLTADPYQESPHGGSALIVNLYANFGMLYPIFIYSIGLFYGYLHQKSYSSTFFRATYLSLLPLLMFHFFREGFVTVIKVMFFNGFLAPLMAIVLMIYFNERFQRKFNKSKILK